MAVIYALQYPTTMQVIFGRCSKMVYIFFGICSLHPTIQGTNFVDLALVKVSCHMIFYVHIILDIWFWGNWLNCHGKDWKKKLVERRLFKQVHEVRMLGWYSSIKKSGPDVSHAQYWHRKGVSIFTTRFSSPQYSR